MSDTELQVREYWEWVVTENPTVESQEVIGGLQSIVMSSTSRRFPGWAYALASAAVVLAFGLLSSLTSQTASEVPVLSQPSPSPTVATPAPINLTWSRVPHDETVFGGPSRTMMVSVTVGGPGFVAVGREAPENGPEDAVLWTSVDGVVWSRVPHDQAVFDRAQMSSVTAGGPGLVAVGGSDSGAAVWTSVDGVVWSRVPHDESVFGGASMKSVTVGGPGLVAVGWDTTLDADRADAAVWTSVDGLVWSRVPHDDSVFGGDDRQVMYGVTAGGPGLVAVGADGDQPWDNSLGQDAAVWTSVDGIVWSRVPHDESVFGVSSPAMFGGPAMFSVTAGGPGLVAVGFSGHRSGLDPAAVWTSVDGIVWSRVPGPAGNRTFLDVTVAGSDLVAVGFGEEVWTSPDGVNWSRVPENRKGFDGEADVRMTSVTFRDSRLVVVGGDSSPGGDAAVWTTTD